MYQSFKTTTGCDIAIYVPGYKRDDITLQRIGDTLIVKGSSTTQFVLNDEIYYKFKVNKTISNIEAELVDGILILHLTKESPQPETINIR